MNDPVEIIECRVRLIRVAQETAQDAMDGMQRICDKNQVPPCQFDEWWKYAQLVLSFLLRERGELPRSKNALVTSVYRWYPDDLFAN